MARPFVDEVSLTVRGGAGGDGCTSFEREPHNSKAGPDGGDGGEGGDVILQATEELNTLSHLNQKSLLAAEDGSRGGSNRKRGASGDDLTVKVPSGTIVYNQENNKVLGELLEAGQTLPVARGGSGGRGNRCFCSSRNQAPRFHEFGEPGEEKKLRIELKLIADVGIVGLPNAGKSTLLARLTNAHPRVAGHPFTTINPNLGVLEQDFRRLTLCDLPGLVNDAHEGAGLGIQFLRHIDRTGLLLHLVDLSSRTPVDDYRVVREELRAYNPQLAEKPTLLVCNKIDLTETGEIEIFAEDIAPAPGPVIGISAEKGTNIERLREKLWQLAEDARVEEQNSSQPEEKVVRLEQREPIKVIPREDKFLLRGDRVRKLVQRFDLRNQEALSYVRSRLLEIGLHKKLEKAGCRPGDTVKIGNKEFEYTG